MKNDLNMIQDVAEFHEQILHVQKPETPSLVSPNFCVERTRFLIEEITEFADAAMTGDMVGAADALGDIVYVALGTAYMMGLPMEKIWASIHAANMRKVRGTTRRGNAIDAKKPEGWVGPESEIARAIGKLI